MNRDHTGCVARVVYDLDRAFAHNEEAKISVAFGKEDLKGAAVEWQKVVDLAPGTPEGEAAKRALEGVAAAVHNNQGTTNQQ